MTSYDEIPYTNFSYSYAAPDRLYAIGRLFGLDPEPVAAARVLELGCGAGGHIIPLAACYPDASFLGIDLSEVQIQSGCESIAALDLGNIALKAADIMTCDLGEQPFDYIIAHGLFSWVPAPVQERVFEICQKHMGPNGVAFVSYNTLPGWHAVEAVRDLMLYHSRDVSDPLKKAQVARQGLAFVAQHVQAPGSAFGQTVRDELILIDGVTDNYLLHDHLGAVNAPCYFSEFMDRARSYDLSYLADVSLPSMFLANYDAGFAKDLPRHSDPMSQEQYIDFITNRRFRKTLLTKRGAQIDRAVSGARLDGLYVSAAYDLAEPVGAAQGGAALERLEQLELVPKSQQGQKMTVSGRVACLCCLVVIQAAPHRLSIVDILAAVLTLAPELEGDRDQLEQDLRGAALMLLFRGVLSLTGAPFAGVRTPSERPKAFSVARHKAKTAAKVTNMAHDSVFLTADQRQVLQYVTGDRTIPEICAALRQHAQRGELTLQKENTPVSPDMAGFDPLLETYVRTQLSAFAKYGLLSA